jgi:hypothetical protein
VANKAAPGDPAPVAGRPGCLQDRPGSTGQPCRLTHLAQEKHMYPSKDVEFFFSFLKKDVYEYTRGLKIDKFSRLEEYFRQKKFMRMGWEMC